jgi:hypothetical protein
MPILPVIYRIPTGRFRTYFINNDTNLSKEVFWYGVHVQHSLKNLEKGKNREWSITKTEY